MSQQIKPITKIKTIKNHIAYVGVEIEGYWYDSHPEIKNDSSVHGFSESWNNCEGSCIDNCNCFQECECNACVRCRNCENQLNECECDECLYCQDCENRADSCVCKIIKICSEEKCGKLGYNCTICQENFNDHNDLSYNCSEGSGISYVCDQECNCECNCKCECNNNVGEVASPKLKINQVENWVNSNYPDESNHTTGLHVHLSFLNDREDYHKIATKKFYDHFMSNIIEWARERGINENSRFWKRIEGTQYTRNEYDAENQLQHNGDRYTHLNYCYYKFAEEGKNGTIEIRLAPVFNDKNISIEYIRKVIDIFNRYLENTKTIIYKFSKNIHINSGYNFTLDLKIKHDQNGLEIFAKSSKFEKLYFPSIDINQIETIKMNNHKVRFFRDMIDLVKQRNCFTSVRVYDEINDMDMPNMIFLKLANLSSGKKVFIDGIYTEKMIEVYINDLYENLDLFVRNNC